MGFRRKVVIAQRVTRHMKPIKDISREWLIKMLWLERKRNEQAEKELSEIEKLERKLQ